MENVRPYIYLPTGVGLPDLAQNRDLTKSIVFLLNYYEFLAAALHSSVLDEKLFRADQEYIVKSLFKHSETLIYKWREDQKRPKLFDKVEWLYRHWSHDEHQ